MKKTICMISGSSPEFLGGVSLYQKNLIEYSKKENLNLDFTWIYAGNENREYSLNEIKCVEIKTKGFPILREFDFSRKVQRYLKINQFNVINTQANWGYFLKKYLVKPKQKIIHTYHGVTMPYMKIQFARFGIFKYLFYPLLPFFYFIEKPPMKKADKISCVSEKVKKEIENLYGKRKNVFVSRAGIDLKYFKKIPRQKARKELKLDNKKIYGLYSGRGGYWNKGLDRAVKLGKEFYKLNKNFRLIVIGSDKDKCAKYLNEEFVIYKGLVERKDLSKFHSASDFFFFLSRYEGGAPALALSEAMSSECLTICSKDSKQEIFENEKDCLILENYGKKEAEKILNLLKNKNKMNSMKKSAFNKIKELSLERWAKKYFEVLLK